MIVCCSAAIPFKMSKSLTILETLTTVKVPPRVDLFIFYLASLWYILILDIIWQCFDWFKVFLQNDQKVVVKRKTELGGMFSIASWIVFIGLFAAWVLMLSIFKLTATICWCESDVFIKNVIFILPCLSHDLRLTWPFSSFSGCSTK